MATKTANRKGEAMTTAMKLTIAEVKETLPDVQVSILGMAVTARVLGRQHSFATVSVPTMEGTMMRDACGPQIDLQFSWETVTRAINDGTALRVT